MSERGRSLEIPSKKIEDPKAEMDGHFKVLEIVQLLDPDEEPKVLARCELVDGAVKIEGDEGLVKELHEEKFYWDGEEVTPDDGEDFLRALKISYHNPYLLARKIN